VAARLAENPDIIVAVVEAGGFYQIESGNRIIVPIYAPFNLALLIDWPFNIENMACAANQSFRYPRGKTLGCSSSLNYMTYQRSSSSLILK
jgi:choline dehydrogenase